MVDESPKRFDRIIAILIQLQSKRIVTAQELATRFDVTIRTIYRDIKALEASGVPIIGEAGSGYSIMEGYRLPPVMFTREEATSFVAAEKLMQHFSDKTLGSYFNSAVYKIKSVLRWAEKDWIDSLDSQIVVKPIHQLFKPTVPNALEILMTGIVNKLQVFIAYQSLESEQPKDRFIEPIGLYHENNYWYMWAYCHYRKEYRQFRTDRITAITSSEKSFTLQHQPLAAYLNETESTSKVTIKLLVQKKVEKYIRRSKTFYGFISEEEKGDMLEMTFRYHEDLDFFARWYLMFGDSASIIEPENLRKRVLELTYEIQDRVESKR